MNINAKTIDLPLAKGGLFNIEDISEVQVTVLEGSVWLTIDHQLNDTILGVGESMVSTEHQRAIVSALGAAKVRLCAKTPSVAPRVRDITAARFAMRQRKH
jgi:Protein of unknown function (DUF2917)